MFELETAIERFLSNKVIMAKGKGRRVREKGKVSLSGYFKKLNDGDNVALVIDPGFQNNLPKRIQGLSGKIVGARGEFKIIELNEGAKRKTFIVHPVHLKKL